jgi:hypothetical protein
MIKIIDNSYSFNGVKLIYGNLSLLRECTKLQLFHYCLLNLNLVIHNDTISSILGWYSKTRSIISKTLVSVFQGKFEKYYNVFYGHCRSNTVFALIILPTCPKTKLEKFSIYSSKFFHNFHLTESSFTCPRLWASGFCTKIGITQHTGYKNNNM